MTAAIPVADAALSVLRETFGYDAFRGAQGEIVSHVASGGDALVLMPTGGGKSLCYQIPALLRTGTGIVVSPLIALMQDQVAALTQAGVARAFLNSSQDAAQSRGVERALLAGGLDLVYVAPERLVMRVASSSSSSRGSRSSPSTRRTACRSGATTSGPSTWACRYCTSASRPCPAWR
jgi:superfamily II DNA helicase RecQ